MSRFGIYIPDIQLVCRAEHYNKIQKQEENIQTLKEWKF